MLWVILMLVGLLAVLTMWPILLKVAGKKPTQWDDEDDPPADRGAS